MPCHARRLPACSWQWAAGLPGAGCCLVLQLETCSALQTLAIFAVLGREACQHVHCSGLQELPATRHHLSCSIASFCLAGIDQTRGWFYTLMVLSTALFDKPAFKSLVCNGLVLAEDGKKMSKRLKNYPVSCKSSGGIANALADLCLQTNPGVKQAPEIC